MSLQTLKIVDTHTGGEPTRTIVGGGPELGVGSMADKLRVFRTEHDQIRSALVNEPRGSEVMVGALLCEASDASNAAGVIFFNNVGYLGMCGHGMIGVAVTLFYLGKIGLGTHTIETPVGPVVVELLSPNRVSIKNVPSYRFAKDIPVAVDGIGKVIGDIAWGGNWFFLIKNHTQEISLEKKEQLVDYSWKVRLALESSGLAGADGAVIDHIELFTKPNDLTIADSLNFVLCPGRAYDRSPCGTGTSAKMACLYADGKLQPGKIWRQQSIVGSIFEGSIEIDHGQIVPTIRGEAFVNLEAVVVCDNNDPFQYGIEVANC